MTMKKDQDRDALVRLAIYEDSVARRREALTQAELELTRGRAVYATARPLTETERTELAEHVRRGGALCCEEGLTWLMKRLPEPWARAINGWAYEHTGCSPSEEMRAMYVDRILALKLDRFSSED